MTEALVLCRRSRAQSRRPSPRASRRRPARAFRRASMAALAAALRPAPRRGDRTRRGVRRRGCAARARRPPWSASASAAATSVPGFGHPLYPDGDPRGARLLEVAQRIGGEVTRGVRILVSVVNAMDLVARERPDDRRRPRRALRGARPAARRAARHLRMRSRRGLDRARARATRRGLHPPPARALRRRRDGRGATSSRARRCAPSPRSSVAGRVAELFARAPVVDHADVADVIELGRGEGRQAERPQAPQDRLRRACTGPERSGGRGSCTMRESGSGSGPGDVEDPAHARARARSSIARDDVGLVDDLHHRVEAQERRDRSAGAGSSTARCARVPRMCTGRRITVSVSGCFQKKLCASMSTSMRSRISLKCCAAEERRVLGEELRVVGLRAVDVRAREDDELRHVELRDVLEQLLEAGDVPRVVLGLPTRAGRA